MITCSVSFSHSPAYDVFCILAVSIGRWNSFLLEFQYWQLSRTCKDLSSWPDQTVTLLSSYSSLSGGGQKLGLVMFDTWSLSNIYSNHPGFTSRQGHNTCWLGNSAFSDGTGMQWCCKGKITEMNGQDLVLCNVFLLFGPSTHLMPTLLPWHDIKMNLTYYIFNKTQSNQLGSEIGFLTLIL